MILTSFLTVCRGNTQHPHAVCSNVEAVPQNVFASAT